ncbi:MAG: PLP-dependent cysteine synthase family protein [Ruminococcaceae bacterium]|nr:PLP-dependent cysteine synthase family protein [Oscillospiraceae bacterium]
MEIENIAALVGKTPLLKIDFTYKGKPGTVFAKAEYYNLTGSIKDRVAQHIIRCAYDSGELKKGDTIVEATSGNTGISFSAVGRALGHPVKIFMPDWMTKERIHIMESFGAEVVLVSREEGGFLGSIAMAEKEGEKADVFLPCQFSNPENTNAHYLYTGQEIVCQLAEMGLTADGFVAGVGTGGTVMGIGRRLRDENPACRVFPLEPKNSPTLSTGYKVGQHKIYGISDEFIPDLVKLTELDSVVSVDDNDAILMSRKLSETLGLGVGVSSGANFLGAVQAWERGVDTVVTVFADDNKKYLSTDYAKADALSPGEMSKEIELTGFTAFR